MKDKIAIVGLGANPLLTEKLRELAGSSAPALSEPAGPLRVVGSGGVVGLRAESANALALTWERLSANARQQRNRLIESDKHSHVAEEVLAERAACYGDCANALRRQMEVATVRQPEPNNSDVGPAGTGATQPKETTR